MRDAGRKPARFGRVGSEMSVSYRGGHGEHSDRRRWEEVWEGMTNTGVHMQSTESQEMGPEDQGVGADGKKVQRT